MIPWTGPQVAVVAEGAKVAAKPRPRTHTAGYKRRIFKEADACALPGVDDDILSLGEALSRRQEDSSP
jgi:hypothetical protein